MGLRTLGAVRAMLCVMTLGFVAASDTATNTSSAATSSNSGGMTVVQLLADVQTAVVNNPALANMFDIPNASQMSEEKLTTLLQDLLNVGLSGDDSGASTTSNEAADEAASASAAESSPSNAKSNTVPVVFAVSILAALGVIL